MPKQGKGGRPESGRITITVRVSRQLKSLLDDAAEAAGVDKSTYVREALVTKLKKDGHIKKSA